MTEKPDRIERTLEVLLYAPVGLGAYILDNGPSLIDMLVTRGRSELDRRHEDVQRQVTTARSLGEVVLAFGPPIARQRVERHLDEARRRAEGLFGSAATDEATPTPAAPVADTARVAAVPPVAPPAVPQTAVAQTAVAHSAPEPPLRFASTTAPPKVVGNGDRGSSAELPIPGYDALSASQVVERLIGLTSDELDAVHAYETAHRQRRTILGKIEQLAG